MACLQIILDELKKKFPSSLRVQRLEGMLLESQGKHDEALELYNSILERDPTHLVKMPDPSANVLLRKVRVEHNEETSRRVQS